MKLVRTDKNRGWVTPFYGFPSVFDDDLFVDMQSTSGLDMWEDETNVYVSVAVPGMNEKDLDVSLENGVLCVRAAREVTDEDAEKGKKVYTSSMKSNYYYSTTLPSNVDSSAVGAELENGVLTVTVEKAPEAKPKKIEVTKKGK